MKLLIINDFSEALGSMSNEEKVTFRETAVTWLSKHNDDGKCEAIYRDWLGHVLVTVWNMAPEEYPAVAMDCPFRDVGTVKYFPVVGIQEMKGIVEKLKS
jgi:hypothetical protein